MRSILIYPSQIMPHDGWSRRLWSNKSAKLTIYLYSTSPSHVPVWKLTSLFLKHYVYKMWHNGKNVKICYIDQYKLSPSSSIFITSANYAFVPCEHSDKSFILFYRFMLFPIIRTGAHRRPAKKPLAAVRSRWRAIILEMFSYKCLSM